MRLIFESWVRKLDDGFSNYTDLDYSLFAKSTSTLNQIDINEDVSSDLLSLFENKSYTDVTFYVGLKEIKAHKNILSCKLKD